MTEDYSAPLASVRGHSALDEPASLLVRFLATSLDVCLALFLVTSAHRLTRSTPFDAPWISLAALVVAWLARMGFRLAFGTSPGEWTWRLRLLTPDRRPPRGFSEWLGAFAHQRERLQSLTLVSAIGLTLLAAGTSWLSFRRELLATPLFSSALVQELPFFVPGAQPSSAEPYAGLDPRWEILSLYYTLGAWPTRLGQAPVLYGLPYEKGPPEQFLGQIVARWDMPEAKLTVHGPRTPNFLRRLQEKEGASSLRARIRDCMTSPWNPLAWSFCFRARRDLLGPSVRSMREKRPESWEMSWFSVLNPTIPESERVEGIHLSAEYSEGMQERYLVFTADGTHQFFVLDRGLGTKGRASARILEEAIRSQRLQPDLGPGKAWVDRQLQAVRLDQLKNVADPASFVDQLARIQGLLLSKITVEPKSFDAYFHLGGTAALLARHAEKQKNLDWSAVAKPMIRSAFRYAKDVAPTDPRTQELQNLWLEAQAH